MKVEVEEVENGEKGGETEEEENKVYFSLRAIRHIVFSLLSECLFTCSHFGF